MEIRFRSEKSLMHCLPIRERENDAIRRVIRPPVFALTKTKYNSSKTTAISCPYSVREKYSPFDPAHSCCYISKDLSFYSYYKYLKSYKSLYQQTDTEKK